MNRTERLYAIVEELRAIAPHTRTAKQLAAEFEVSTRTIERDVAGLQQAGLPIWSNIGRRGGLGIDPTFTLAPLNFTVNEALAIGIALSRDLASPFDAPARSALRKVVSVLPEARLNDARLVSERIRFVIPTTETTASAINRTIADAVVRARVLEIAYEDSAGAATTRQIEPIGLLVNGDSWYLVGWCLLRNDTRAFRLDRVRDATVTERAAPERPFDLTESELRDLVRPIAWS